MPLGDLAGRVLASDLLELRRLVGAVIAFEPACGLIEELRCPEGLFVIERATFAGLDGQVLPAVALVCEDGERDIGVALFLRVWTSLFWTKREGLQFFCAAFLLSVGGSCACGAVPLCVGAASCNKSETMGERQQTGLPKEPRGVLVIRVMVAARIDGDRCARCLIDQSVLLVDAAREKAR